MFKKLFKKLNKWIIDNIRLWLGIKEDLSRIGKSVDDRVLDVLQKTDRRFKDLDISIIEINRDLNVIKTTCQIGVDVHMKTDSWAVVCINGKQDYVNFVRLDSRDARDVKHFLKQFESSSITLDTPYRIMETMKW